MSGISNEDTGNSELSIISDDKDTGNSELGEQGDDKDTGIAVLGGINSGRWKRETHPAWFIQPTPKAIHEGDIIACRLVADGDKLLHIVLQTTATLKNKNHSSTESRAILRCHINGSNPFSSSHLLSHFESDEDDEESKITKVFIKSHK